MKTIEAVIQVSKVITIKARAKSIEEAVEKIEKRAKSICDNQDLNYPTLSYMKYTDGVLVEGFEEHLTYIDC
jgi:ribonucleotide monophosphatase NagD (HAD superfamily)